MEGKIVVVTGGNSGIGKEAAAELAGKGARVVIAARSQEKGEAAVADIVDRNPDAQVELMSLDLASFASIRGFAKEFCDRYLRLDVLLNNAGLVLSNRRETVEGFEMTFGVNHLGHFLLTSLLLDRLKESAPARIINVSSDAHRYAITGLDFDDLQSTKHYFNFGVYGRSKLANIYFSNELARRLKDTGVTSNALHPGFVATNFAKDGDGGRIGEISTRLLSPFAISPAKGALTSIFLGSAPEVETITGKYWYKCAQRAISKAANDDNAAFRLWDVSEELTRS